ncbi:hypothetical protein [Salinisphaera orenii]|uniref:hypothetical protein n=1 Tax=Salinisphaera orenii TaxID=856731 RepID=UPI000F4C9398|nr:hypothetical protein [Salinisphaera orenii]
MTELDRTTVNGRRVHAPRRRAAVFQPRQSFACHRQAASNARLTAFLDRFDAMGYRVVPAPLGALLA